ncbi:MAG: ribose-5-phosphate isomerase [Candidatus Lloydbacteria bacterium CG22_combo_CG10-13_8_21_14_all_47_15]|uniref:Ribose-5-phosphate isomerase n=1 Tax=Candidatus Lloydbacteria bacterium CG22_combo_CG10-13_8_21_14_all_47_15 TaxID=1974635 RepID=A0A2H0CVS0_9BACT|nr:MAG: ribose-5-phosphate isomerase [Candidatus Lloydbacteria bacterium CG22_combo_CG10-13_8_21_14_all_47_15]
MIIYLGSDHAGYALKETLEIFLRELGYAATDAGPDQYDATDDYPDYITPVACRVSEKPEESRGIILGGSGQGEAMMANRFPHVRAMVYYGGQIETVKLAREHNDANILSLGARFISEEEAKEAVQAWLETPFSAEERHIRRIQKIEDLSKNC